MWSGVFARYTLSPDTLRFGRTRRAELRSLAGQPVDRAEPNVTGTEERKISVKLREVREATIFSSGLMTWLYLADFVHTP